MFVVLCGSRLCPEPSDRALASRRSLRLDAYRSGFLDARASASSWEGDLDGSGGVWLKVKSPQSKEAEFANDQHRLQRDPESRELNFLYVEESRAHGLPRTEP
jgi:hypothetical protein